MEYFRKVVQRYSTPTLSLENRFTSLSEDDSSTSGSECESEFKEVYNSKPKRPRKKKICVSVGNTAPVVGQPANPQDINRPYASSLYVSGRVAGRNVRFLIDSGCTTNLLSLHVYNRLPGSVRDTLVTSETQQKGVMADGTPIEFTGTIRLNCRIGKVKMAENFLVTKIKEDSILGMPFLVEHNCSADFNQAIVNIDGNSVACVDRFGRPLSENVYLVRDAELPPLTEKLILCRVSNGGTSPTGLIEGCGEKLQVASSLNKPDSKGRVVIRCLNPSLSSMTLPAGSLLGTYQRVEEGMICGDESPHAAGAAPSPSDQYHPIPSHLKELFDQACSTCHASEQRQAIQALLSRHGGCFSKNDDDMGHTELVTHSIPTKPGTRPIRQPVRRLGPEKEREVEKQTRELLEKGLIEPARSGWSSPVVLVKRKDGRWRFCIDYRRLNAVTEPDVFPLPRIDESLEALAGSQYFSTLDLLSGYWQVPLDEDAKEKSSFITRGGLWQWKVLPFGLTSAPATFQRLMENVLHGLHWKTLLLYLDDIIVISPDFETHLERLEEVFTRLQKAGLKLKPSKCHLFQEEVKYLGHIVSRNGISTDPEKVEAVAEWPTPSNINDLRSFMGTVGYYRQYIEDFAEVSSPLTLLTCKGQDWVWSCDQEQAFQRLKQNLVTAPVLHYPDPNLTYILDTDASASGVGAVLSQEKDGMEGVIAFYSRRLNDAEKNYCVTRRELLAVIKAVKHFRPYLYGRPFRLRTDHASLIWLCKRTEPTSQVARWLETLAEFSYSIEHRAGSKHGNADGLSRRPCAECKQCKHIEERDGGPTKDELAALISDGQTFEWQQGKLNVSYDMVPETRGKASQAVHTVSLTGNTEELVRMQKQGYGPVALTYEAVSAGKDIDPEELQRGSDELRRLERKTGSMYIDSTKLLKLVLPKGGSGENKHVTIAPSEVRNKLVWDCHSLVHSGTTRTLARLSLDWYWPGMARDVKQAVLTCEVCQAAKHGTAQRCAGKRRLYAGRPWQTVAVDLVGPMPLSDRGNSWILVVSDHFTRWSDALAIPDGTAAVVARVLDERLFCYFGLPEQIHSDQGSQFESLLMEELCRMWKVNKTHTTPYNPKGNGVVERNNRSLGESLRALLLGASQTEWDDLLPHIMRVHRALPSTSTGETPNMLMLGRELRIPDQVTFYSPPTQLPTSEYVTQMLTRLEKVHSMLRDEQRETRQADTDEPPLFQAGDQVWMKNHRKRRGDCQKLQPKFVGPFKVLEAFPNHTYRIAQSGQESVQNESRLKRFLPCSYKTGQAPVLVEPSRQLAMKGVKRNRRRASSEGEIVRPEIRHGQPLEADCEGDQTPEQAPTFTRTGRTTKFPARYQEFDCGRLKSYEAQAGCIGIGRVCENNCDNYIADHNDSLDELLMELHMDAPSAYAAFDAELGALNTGPPVPYKGARPTTDGEQVGEEEQREGSDGEQVGEEEQREGSDGEQVGEEEQREDDVLSIHLPEEEEVRLNMVANHPTRPRWVTTDSDRRITQLMGATGTKCTGCGFEATNRKSLKKHVTTHVYVYICRCGFSSYWLYSVQKHAKACLVTDNIAYRVDEHSFHDWKVSCGCSLEEHPGLRPTSAENTHRRPASLPSRLGKRRHVEDGYREHRAKMDVEDLEAIERRISRANSRLHALRTHTIRECDFIEQEFASARRTLHDLKQRRIN